jgi:predicted hydrocarbon binding protein
VTNVPNILSTLGLEGVIGDEPFARDDRDRFVDSSGARVVFAPAEAIQGLHRVIERERAGAWQPTMKACGQACGRQIAMNFDLKLAALGKPALAALPLEAAMALLERAFAAHGWGRLKLDLTYAGDHGVVVGRLNHSLFVETLPKADHFVDGMVGGILQGFFEYISGQTLGCEEIACGRRGAAECAFVIAPPEKLAAVRPQIGHETGEAILLHLTRGTP